MDFTKLIESLDAGNIDEVKTSLVAFQPEFEKTVTDLRSYEAKFNDSIKSRDKAKSKLGEISEALGLNGDDLTADAIRELITKRKGDDASKAEIENLTKLLKAKDEEMTTKSSEFEGKFRDKVLDYEIAKIGLTADVVNDKALSLVIQSLKDGAYIEEGQIVYRDENGATLRNGAGRPLSIAERMAEFKADTNNAFLFKATAQSGGGSQTTIGGSHSGGRIPLDGDKSARLKAIESKFLKG